MTDLEKVELFHEVFGVPVLNAPELPSKDRIELRIRLLQEELNELSLAALGESDMTDTADALADIAYILYGTVLEFGLGEHFEKLFDIVHESNMSKACETEELADKTIEYYKSTRGVDSYKELTDHGWIVKRSSDHKVLKSIAYMPAEPEISKLLDSE